jgi:hypothetical protein
MHLNTINRRLDLFPNGSLYHPLIDPFGYEQGSDRRAAPWRICNNGDNPCSHTQKVPFGEPILQPIVNSPKYGPTNRPGRMRDKDGNQRPMFLERMTSRLCKLLFRLLEFRKRPEKATLSRELDAIRPFNGIRARLGSSRFMAEVLFQDRDRPVLRLAAPSYCR